MRQDVGGDTWTFTWDDNGNLMGKTNGVDTWTYTWDTLTNRLLRVQGPGSVDVNYTYDMAGRMLTRDDGVDVTTFVWDQFDCIREQTGMSTTTYCIPEGVLTSFIRDGDRFDVHTDALLSIRMITDENCDVVLRREFDAFGNELSGSFDNVPGGFDFGFAGGVGCRKDPSTDLVYMRARHYDPSLRRFVSTDPVGLNGGANAYTYVANSPTSLIDPTGLIPNRPRSDGPSTPEDLFYGKPKKGWKYKKIRYIIRDCSCPPHEITFEEAWMLGFLMMPPGLGEAAGEILLARGAEEVIAPAPAAAGLANKALNLTPEMLGGAKANIEILEGTLMQNGRYVQADIQSIAALDRQQGGVLRNALEGLAKMGREMGAAKMRIKGHSVVSPAIEPGMSSAANANGWIFNPKDMSITIYFCRGTLPGK